MHNYPEYLNLIVRYLNNPQDESLHAEITSYRAESPENELHFKEVERIWQLSSKSSRLDLLKVKDAEKNFKFSLKAVSSRSSSLTKWLSGVAAGIFIAGAGLIFFNTKTRAELVTVKTGVGQTDTISLVDGSKIILAENSVIKYPSKFLEKTRDVSLDKGRAFFLISKDPKHAFRVNMGESRVSVLGTSFNLIFSKSKIDLDVKTGRVLFLPYKDAVSSILSAGQGLSYNISQKQFVARLSQNSDSWITKELIFVDTPLEEVCKQLSACYGVEITFDPGKRINKKFNATFKNEDLKDILKVLQETYDIKIRKEGTQLVLKTP
ncbi:FecR family protein [Pedobacter jeongneungensis]|uniref:FecR family protein n=1 Tax=Pedobacter jeongneungensis TaxID=947309 RepID=UPI00046A1257|nr:FecR domain-containing protein [Pedobacter jeongneungensis]